MALLIPRNSDLYRPSNDALKRKWNPQTDTFRRLIDLICYLPLSRPNFSNLEKFNERTFIWWKGNFKIYDKERQKNNNNKVKAKTNKQSKQCFHMKWWVSRQCFCKWRRVKISQEERKKAIHRGTKTKRNYPFPELWLFYFWIGF